MSPKDKLNQAPVVYSNGDAMDNPIYIGAYAAEDLKPNDFDLHFDPRETSTGGDYDRLSKYAAPDDSLLIVNSAGNSREDLLYAPLYSPIKKN